jgi:hypothetical protein
LCPALRSFRAFALAPAILAPALAFGESLPEPVSGEISAETSFHAVLNPVYDDANGRSNELAHSLGLYRLQTSFSYGLSSSFALGIVGTYAANRYCCLNGIAIQDSGFTGGGLFVDWRPGALAGRSNLVRLGYQSQRGPDNAVLPVSDGQDRLFLRSDWSILAWRRDQARLGMRLDLDYGRPFEIEKGYFRASAELAPQVPAVRSQGWDFDIVGTAGYLIATDARENGTIYHNRRSTQARVGAELDLGLGRHRRDQIILEAKHDFAARNALNGWRIGLTYRRRIGMGG